MTVIRSIWDKYLQIKSENSEFIRNNKMLAKREILNAQSANIFLESQNKKFNLISIHGYSIVRLFGTLSVEEILIRDYNTEFSDSATFTEQENHQIDLQFDFRKKMVLEFLCIWIINLIKDNIIKLDQLSDQHKFIISPPKNPKNIQRFISLFLQDDNSNWNSIFSGEQFLREGFLIPTNEYGTGIVEISRKEIVSKWSSFCSAYKIRFGVNLLINPDEYFNIWEYFKWIFVPPYFSKLDENEIKKGIGFNSTENIDSIIKLCSQVLPDLASIHLPTSISDINKIFFEKIFDFGLGNKVSYDNCEYYYLSAPRTLGHFLKKPITKMLALENNPGPKYEAELNIRLEAINIGRIRIKRDNNSLYGYKPMSIENMEKKNPIPFEFKIICPPNEFKVPAIVKSKYNIADEKGEIDLIVHSGKTLFILEAKSYLSSNPDLQHASRQCVKYLEYSKTLKFKELMRTFGIEFWQEIRIYIITNRQESRLYVQEQNSKLFFPIVSFPILIPLLYGIIKPYLGIKNIIPLTVNENINEFIQELYPDFTLSLGNVDEFEKFSNIWSKFIHILIHVTDNPDGFSFQLNEYPFPNAGIESFQSKLDPNVDWELTNFINIMSTKGYSLYLLTELSGMHTKYICHFCKSVWVVYNPGREIKLGTNLKIIRDNKCPNCKNSPLSESNSLDTEINSAFSVGLLQYQVYQQKLLLSDG